MSLAPPFFRWHRWLAYLVALQVLLWVAGGLLFAWLPFQDWVKAQALVDKPRLALPPDWPARLARGLGDQPLPASGVQAVPTAAGTAFRVRSADGERWLDLDGRPLGRPDAAQVGRFAAALYKGQAPLQAVEWMPEAPRRLGLVQEAPTGRAVWRVAFDDALKTRLFLDASTGELLTVRNEAWIWYDFFFRLHVMDYRGGEDFNNPLLRAATVAAAGLVLSGGVLLALALRRAWRPRRA